MSDSIRPRLVLDIEIMSWRKKQVLVAQVYPSGARPHYLARLGPEEGIFVRVGSTNRRADAAQIQEMRRFADQGSFDEQPIPELKPEALDFRVASELFAHLRKLSPAAFRTLRATTRYQEHDVPTVGGYILFAKDRFDRFPDAWIQAGRFAGKDRSRVADSVQIRSHLPRAIEEAIAFVQKHMSREAVIGPVRRTDRWSVPPAALREAIVNAVVHADYAERGVPIRVAVFDDRIEIDNPGILPLGLTLEDIRKGVSKLRNRVIGSVFQELGLTEQWGSGIQRMTAACTDAGLPAPVLEELGSRFRATLSMIASGPARLDKKDEAILRLLADGRGHSTARIAKAASLSVRAVRNRQKALVERGLVTEVGSSPQDPRRLYFRAEPQG
ncbi:putative transcriptional regulator with HTH domain [Candidatus Sulfopaludibacter sp. SbA4]|nr:putative transcriptional regulator with HTH domain [Candidatus Sulfopaludibacter sp. SbA4]